MLIEVNIVIATYSHFDRTFSKATTHRESPREAGVSRIPVRGSERVMDELEPTHWIGSIMGMAMVRLKRTRERREEANKTI